MEKAAGKLAMHVAKTVPIYKGTVDNMLSENNVNSYLAYYINKAWDDCEGKSHRNSLTLD